MPQQEYTSYEDLLKQQETESRLNIGNQLDIDVEQATRVLKLRGQTGLPYEVLHNDTDYIEKQTELGEFDPKKYRDTNPKWAKFAADNPFHLAVLKDDEPNLTRTEYVLDALFDWSAIPKAVKSSFANREIGLIGDRQRAGDERETDAADIKELEKYTVDHRFDTTWLKGLVVDLTLQSANMIGAYNQGLHTAKYTAPAGAVIGAAYFAPATPVSFGSAPVVGAIAGYGAGFTSGMIGGSFGYSKKVEGGHAYLEYIDMGFSKEDAAWASTIAGNIGGLLEATGGNLIFSRLPGVRALTGRASDDIVKQLMGRTTFRQVAGKAVKDWGIGVAGEVVTEIGQEATTMVMGEILKAKNDRTDFLSYDEWVSRIADIAVITLRSTVLIAGVGPGQRLITDGNRANDARGRMLAIQALGDTAKDSKLRKSVPGKWREFVESVRKDGPVDHVLVGVDEFDTYFQGQGKDPDEVAAELGIKNLESARELGTKLEIPLGAYAEKIAATEHNAGLGPDISFREGDMTYRQHEEFESIKEDLQKEIQALSTPTDDESSVEQQRMLKDITDQLIAANTEPGLAQEQAMIMVGFLNLDKEMGYEPGTLITRMFAGVRKDLPGDKKDFDIDIDPLLNKLRSEEYPSQREMHGQSLLELIKEHGGLSDEGGELASRDWDDLITKGGDSLDGVAEIAHEAGFIAERDPELLIEAIEAEREGRPSYGFDSPGDPLMRRLSEKLDDLASFLQAEEIDLSVLTNSEVRALLEAGDKFEQVDFEGLRERMESGDLAQMMSGMPHLFDEQDFGDVAFTDTVRLKETGELVDVAKPAQKIFDRAVVRRNNLRKLLECVSA